jgi:hypothetical protein
MDATAIPIAVHTARSGRGISLKIVLDPTTLALGQQSGRWQGKLDVITRFATDSGEQAGQPSAHTTEIDLSQSNYEETVRQGTLAFPLEREIPAGSGQLRVLVRDTASGAIGTVTIDLDQIADE